MKSASIFGVLIAIALSGCGKPAGDHGQAGVTISNGWCRASPQGAKMASCFLTITNGASADDSVTGGTSAAANKVQIDETYTDGNALRMRPVDGLAIPANKSVQLAAGGDVIRLVDLTEPLVVGSTVPVVLHFKTAGDKQVLFPVRIEADN